MARIALWMAGIGLVVAFSVSASIAMADDSKNTATTQPSSDLTPQAVVKLVADALRTNDAKDSGIRTAWKFASPGNQAVTGPIEKFIPMVKSPQYQPMLNAKKADVRELSKGDSTAAELVIFTDANGDKTYYIFQMSKQSDGDLKDCWMTDGVLRVKPKEHPRGNSPDGTSPV
jgi:hypothetical protein